MLCGKLKPAIQSINAEDSHHKECQDNSCPHTASYSVQALHQLRCEVLEHILYSPDCPSDWNLFGPLKSVLRDRVVLPAGMS
jgi:hypothetical protein